MISQRQLISRPLTWIVSISIASTFAFGSSFAACNSTCPEGTHNKTCNQASDGPVARINGQDISHAELHDRASAQLSQLEMQRNQMLEEALQQLIDERLINMEAERRGTTPEALMDSEVLTKIQVTDEDVDQWYTANQARIRKPKEAVADQIRNMIIGQRSQDLRQQLINGLRAEHKVQSLLEPFRVDFPSLAAADGPTKGAEDAPIEVTVFSDFQCPYCRNIAPVMDQVVETYGEKVRLQFRQFPLTSIHPQAMKAAEVTACAQDQGKFWDLHDALFDRFGELAIDQLLDRADESGLNLEALNGCLDSGEGRRIVDQDMKLGRAAGVAGTPAVFVNGRQVVLKGRTPPLNLISTVVNDEVGRLGL